MTNPPSTSTLVLDPHVYSAREIEPAPTLVVHMSTPNGHTSVSVLPDSGAEISVAGHRLLTLLQEHSHNLLSSSMAPRAVNGQSMHSLGRLPVTLGLGDRTIVEDFHSYIEVSMTIISWKTSKYLSILPEHYPQPTPPPMVTLIKSMPPNDIRAEFPQVFDGQIKTMEGELFHIALMAEAKPFCVHALHTIPYTFRD